jgi:taurine dioxygenase
MAGIEIVPVTVEVGAEVRGLDLRKPLAPEEVRGVERALAAHGVLFFRDQHLTPEQHLAFARSFGALDPAPFGPKHERHREITVLDQVLPKGQGADNWHTDNTFMPEPPMGSILRAIELPGVGGDTCFASMYAAWDALSPAMQSFLSGLRAVHDLTRTLSRAIRDGNAPGAELARMQKDWPPVEHPVARRHPVTGRIALFVNGNFTSHLVGLAPAESDALLRMLFDHVRSPDFQCRFRWRPGSIAFWDNRCVQHYGVPDYGERRLMHRVTLAGDRPV